MTTRVLHGGATLPELLILLSLVAILASMSLSVAGHARDGVAVRAARDAVAAELARARALARLHGAARVRFHSGTMRVEAPRDSMRIERSIGGAFGVEVAADGAAGELVLEFDALGLGRLVNRTIRFRRNDAEARLTLSSYGRPRRW